MANVKISELTNENTPVGADSIPFYDASVLASRRTTITNLVTAISALQSFLANISEDTTPQLGGDLDAQSNDITSVGRFDYTYAEGTVSALGNLGTTETLDWSTLTFFTATLDSNVTISHSNETSGQKITGIFAYDGSAQRTITWSGVDTWLDSIDGSAPTTPSGSGEVLVVTMIYIGTTCYATATGNYAVY